MAEFLVFRLYGPLAAWGDIAVGEQRPTTPHPSKSAILGLVAAALGIRRHEDEKHQALVDGYGYAVRVDAAGVMLRDYHTVQVPDATSRLKHLRTRRDEVQDRHNLYTVLSARDYRCEGLYTVALGRRGEAAEAPEVMAEALRKPRLPLYLGRKSCPLALPLLPHCVTAADFEAALMDYDAAQSAEQRALVAKVRSALGPAGQAPDLYWETGMSVSDRTPLHTTPRHDLPLSRRRWQFCPRDEHYGKGTA
jgi:CRISPR system Cascade subunit CasD